MCAILNRNLDLTNYPYLGLIMNPLNEKLQTSEHPEIVLHHVVFLRLFRFQGAAHEFFDIGAKIKLGHVFCTGLRAHLV